MEMQLVCSARHVEGFILPPFLWMMVKYRPVSRDSTGAIASLDKAQHAGSMLHETQALV